MALLGMHMANELLSLPVAGVTLALAAAAVGVAARRLRRGLDAERLPLMGVMGAFVFAAQMVNFTLPGLPGTSGHLGGGVLLGVLLGPAAGIVTMSSVLIVQCLLFQDGGLLALGCNILNMGVVPCLVGWGVFRLVTLRGEPRPWRLYLATWAACILAVVLGAALVPVEAGLSGVLLVAPADFLGLMVSVHLVVGFLEGLITFAVLTYLRRTRSALLVGATAVAVCRRAADGPLPAAPAHCAGGRVVAASFVVTAVLLAGVISWFASPQPDGLEWALGRLGQAQRVLPEPKPAVTAVGQLQDRVTPMKDYTVRRASPADTPHDSAATPGSEAAGGPGSAASTWPNIDGWGSLAGLAGTAVVLGVLYGLSRLLRRRRRVAAD